MSSIEGIERRKQLNARVRRRRATAALVAAISTINGILLIIQSTITQPPLDAFFPTWIYVAVNGGVVAIAGLMKLVSFLLPGVSRRTTTPVSTRSSTPGTGGTRRPKAAGLSDDDAQRPVRES